MTMYCWTVVYRLNNSTIMHGYVVAGNKQAAERRANEQYPNVTKVLRK